MPGPLVKVKHARGHVPSAGTEWGGEHLEGEFMTGGPLFEQTPISASRADVRTRAKTAVVLAVVAAVLRALAFALVGLMGALARAGASEDNSLGFFYWGLVTVVIAAWPASFALAITAFVRAIVALARRERWKMQWIPLSVFPAMLVFEVLYWVFVFEG